MKDHMRTRIALDLDALSLLNLLPHVALIFTLLSGAKLVSILLLITTGNLDPSQGLPSLENFPVFFLMVPILIRYKVKKKAPRKEKHALFTKLSITCFALGSLLIAAGIVIPILSSVAAGGPLIIAGLLATLLDRRLYLLSTGKGQPDWLSTYKNIKE